MSVIIVGGGMTGATLALAISQLTQGQLPVHLVEAVAPQAADHPGFDARAIALAQGTCQQLARIGIWQAIADCATAIGTVHVSDRGHAGFVTLDAHDYRIEALGQVVELHDVGLRLFRLLQDAPGVTLHCPARVASFSRCDEAVSVTLDNGTTLEGQLLVAADGSRSAIARSAASNGALNPMGRRRSSLTSPRLARITAGHLSASRSTARWPCCRCRTGAARWYGAMRRVGPMRFSPGPTNVFVPSCKRPSAGGLGASPTPENAWPIRSR